MSVCPMHAFSLEIRKTCQIHWNWSYRRMTIWGLGFKPGSSIRIVTVINL